jgi:hypothetical protein
MTAVPSMTSSRSQRQSAIGPRRFKIGDHVRPKPEWKNDPNQIPTGIVRKIEVWGSDGALYVGDEWRAFAAYVFEPNGDADEI